MSVRLILTNEGGLRGGHEENGFFLIQRIILWLCMLRPLSYRGDGQAERGISLSLILQNSWFLVKCNFNIYSTSDIHYKCPL